MKQKTIFPKMNNKTCLNDKKGKWEGNALNDFSSSSFPGMKLSLSNLSFSFLFTHKFPSHANEPTWTSLSTYNRTYTLLYVCLWHSLSTATFSLLHSYSILSLSLFIKWTRILTHTHWYFLSFFTLIFSFQFGVILPIYL